MLDFKLSGWNAFSPGLSSIKLWSQWSNNEYDHDLLKSNEKPLLKGIPPLLRRRFTDVGKLTIGSAMPMLEDYGQIPMVFASRHGDVDLTLSLLESIADKEPLSPTKFSLAVHNAISGLMSIARKDVSEVTAIAATNALIPNALLEAATQLQVHDHVLCVICDTPLPRVYQPFADSCQFPYAIALILSKTEGVSLTLKHQLYEASSCNNQDELKAFIALLCNHTVSISFNSLETQTQWIVERSYHA